MALPSSFQRDSKQSPAPLGRLGWGGRGGCPEQGQPRSSCVPLGRSPTRPPGCVFSHRQVSSPATHQASGSILRMLPWCCLALHTPSRHPRAPNTFFPCHLHIPSVEGGNNQRGMRPQSPWTFHPSHGLKPIPALESILCVTRHFLDREMSEKIHPQLRPCPNSLEKRQEIPECFTFTSFPPFQACRCCETQPGQLDRKSVV